MIQERIEAAAVTLCEQLWENAHERQKEYALEEAAEALAAADAVMFSDEAIERAAVALWNHDFPSSPIENVAELLKWTRGRRLEQARIVVAALKGDA